LAHNLLIPGGSIKKKSVYGRNCPTRGLDMHLMMKYQMTIEKLFAASALKFSLSVVLAMFVQLLFMGTVQAKAELMGVRVGQHTDKTRVVLEIRKNLGFKVSKLENPPRVVVDFYKAKNHIKFKQKSFRDPYLHRIRVKDQTKTAAKRTQLILDLRSIADYRYFTLGKNARGNERVVIDLYPSKKHKKVVKRLQKGKQKAQKTGQKPKVTKIKVVKSSEAKSKLTLASRHPKHQVTAFNTDAKQLLKRFSQAPIKGKKSLVVVIDPGHGGRDTGAIGPTGLYEKKVTLALAKKLKRYIDAQPGMRAVLTRDRDVWIPLAKRVEIAHRKKGDIFISIHADAFPMRKVRGGSIYVLSTNGASSVMAKLLAKSENAHLKGMRLSVDKDQDVAFALSDIAREANIRASRNLAQRVLYEMQKTVVVHKHKVQAAEFAVLKSIDMPSLLIEAAFISNPHEEKNLANAHFQTKFAKSVVRGLKRFVKEKSVQPGWGESLYVYHKVERGDTLSEIAATYKVSVRELKRLNRIRNANQLYVGKRLKIPLTERLLAGL